MPDNFSLFNFVLRVVVSRERPENPTGEYVEISEITGHQALYFAVNN